MRIAADSHVWAGKQVAHTVRPSGEDAAFTWEDRTPLSDVMLPPAKWSPRPFCFYYLRATQQNGETAWASPVWIEGV